MFSQSIKKLVCAGLLFSVCGCVSAEWAPVQQKAEPMVWPNAPNPTKARFVGEIKGFKKTRKTIIDIISGRQNSVNIGKPVAVQVGSDDRIAIADIEKKGVHLYTPADKKYRFLYRSKNEEFQSPVGLCFDNRLNLYVSDSILKKVLVFDKDGLFVKEITKAGDKPFSRPTGITYDRKYNHLLITDTTLHMVHLFDLEKGYQKSIGQRGASSRRFNFPTHIDTDSSGRLFVTDAMNFKIKLFDAAGNFISQFGNHGDGSGDFAMPKGIRVDRWGTIYVVDSLFDSIQLFNEAGQFLLTMGAKGQGPGEFWLPGGLDIDHNNKLYACDTYNRRIQIFQLYDNKLL